MRQTRRHGRFQNTCDGSKDQVWQTVSSKNSKDYSRLRNAATGECIG
ncbi:hypothetical protein [Streptomyces lunaelactis]|nr:hypothetical protein [Streptomyces lunaelactis]NUK01084.1 hypothetical protein [Streptomyces lunaelactis]NUK18035.1 hypothetical protein [Streptomyces lunaelactis]